MLFYRAKARKERQHSSYSAGSPAGTWSTDMVQVKPRHSLSCCFSLRCYAGKLRGSGQQEEGQASPFCTEPPTKHTTLSLGRLSLTCLQLEVVGRERLPWRGQGCNGLKMQHVLLHVCRGVADPVGNEPFNYSSWYKNHSPPRNIVTNRDISRLLQDFNLKHTGKWFLFWFCWQFNRYMMGPLIPNKAPLQASCMCLKDQCHTELVKELTTATHRSPI